MEYKKILERSNVVVAGGARPHRQRASQMYYTYILESLRDKNLYIGYTDNLKERFGSHQKGKNISTASRTPFSLIYYEACLSKDAAIRREKYFKTGFGRRFLSNRLKGSRGGRV